jgi:hypothetical protein
MYYAPLDRVDPLTGISPRFSSLEGAGLDNSRPIEPIHTVSSTLLPDIFSFLVANYPNLITIKPVW